MFLWWRESFRLETVGKQPRAAVKATTAANFKTIKMGKTRHEWKTKFEAGKKLLHFFCPNTVRRHKNAELASTSSSPVSLSSSTLTSSSSLPSSLSSLLPPSSSNSHHGLPFASLKNRKLKEKKPLCLRRRWQLFPHQGWHDSWVTMSPKTLQNVVLLVFKPLEEIFPGKFHRRIFFSRPSGPNKQRCKMKPWERISFLESLFSKIVVT